jgi:hypothetical protein
MADIIGRRTSLIIGSFPGTLGFVVLSASSSFSGFMVAEKIYCWLNHISPTWPIGPGFK